MNRTQIGTAQAQVLLACTLAGDRQIAITERARRLWNMNGKHVEQALQTLSRRNLVREFAPRCWALESNAAVDETLDFAHDLIYGADDD